MASEELLIASVLHVPLLSEASQPSRKKSRDRGRMSIVLAICLTGGTRPVTPYNGV